MQQQKATGPRAAALKYNILTALLCLGLHDRQVDGRLAQRLSLVITARFNWRSETFCVGTAELARMWAVTERTAKREIALMRAKNWIVIHRAAARGRVTEHRIALDCVLDATRPYWPAIGTDFVAQMGQGPNEATPDRTIVPFPKSARLPPVADGTLWAAAALAIHQSDPALHAAWFAQLTEVAQEGRKLTLAAPSRFVGNYVQTHLAGRLLAAVSRIDPRVTDVAIIAGDEAGRG